jgi:hypothetical protein
VLSLNWAGSATAKRGLDVALEGAVGSTCKVAAGLVPGDAAWAPWCLLGRQSTVSKKRSRAATPDLDPVIAMVLTLMPNTGAGTTGGIGQPRSVIVPPAATGTAIAAIGLLCPLSI